MIGRKPPDMVNHEVVAPKSFDDFDLKLGDVMRGERATMGKSLLDVQRELRIKASYISAIENCDPSAFDTPGFIAGYVRSYARYLNMDPDETFRLFCEESGFQTAHGMSAEASGKSRKSGAAADTARQTGPRDVLADSSLTFAGENDSFLSRVEPGAVGSSLVLLGVIAAISYGGWAVLQEVQRVQLSPVDQTPVVLSDLDPLDTVVTAAIDASDVPLTDDSENLSPTAEGIGVFSPPSSEALDRLYRPQALDVPVLVARDAPISSLDPESVGNFAAQVRQELPRLAVSTQPGVPAYNDPNAPDLSPGSLFASQTAVAGLSVVAARPAWVRVSDAAGATLFEGVMNAGDTWQVPADADTPTLQVGESSAVYFAANGRAFGPVGGRGAVTTNIDLSIPAVSERFAEADLSTNPELEQTFAGLLAPAGPIAIAGQPRVVEDLPPGVTIVATRDAWVRVRGANGTTLFESVMSAGDTFNVPQTEQAPTIRTGDAGAVFFAVNGQTYGPYGANGSIADNLELSVASVTQKMSVASLEDYSALAKVIAELALPQTGASE